MELGNRWLICEDCHREFLWDVGEQAWYKLKGLKNSPKHCKDCRAKRQQERAHKPRQFSKVECDECGTPAVVPFVPKGNKPVYCADCLSWRRAQA